MKRAVKISRIVMCAIISLYTLYVYIVAGYTVRMKCMRIELDQDGYYMVFEGWNPDAIFYIVFAMVLLLLGVACIILLFRPSRMPCVIAGILALLSAVLGVCLDTQLAELTLIREHLAPLLGRVTAGNVTMELKPLLARFCIYIAICYVALQLTAQYKQHRKENK